MDFYMVSEPQVSCDDGSFPFVVVHVFGHWLPHVRGRVKVSHIAKISFTWALYKPWCPLISQGVF
jgi:hypothetical protein